MCLFFRRSLPAWQTSSLSLSSFYFLCPSASLLRFLLSPPLPFPLNPRDPLSALLSMSPSPPPPAVYRGVACSPSVRRCLPVGLPRRGAACCRLGLTRSELLLEQASRLPAGCQPCPRPWQPEEQPHHQPTAAHRGAPVALPASLGWVDETTRGGRFSRVRFTSPAPAYPALALCAPCACVGAVRPCAVHVQGLVRAATQRGCARLRPLPRPRGQAPRTTEVFSLSQRPLRPVPPVRLQLQRLQLIVWATRRLDLVQSSALTAQTAPHAVASPWRLRAAVTQDQYACPSLPLSPKSPSGLRAYGAALGATPCLGPRTFGRLFVSQPASQQPASLSLRLLVPVRPTVLDRSVRLSVPPAPRLRARYLSIRSIRFPPPPPLPPLARSSIPSIPPLGSPRRAPHPLCVILLLRVFVSLAPFPCSLLRPFLRRFLRSGSE